MASITTNQSDNLNVELNLVPFIDLLSCLVAFLLITAVWTQIASLPAAVHSQGKISRELNQALDERLQVHLTPRGLELNWPAKYAQKGKLPRQMPKVEKDFNFAGLTAVLKGLPTIAGLSGAVSSEDEVSYGAVIHAVDALKTAGLSSVALSTN